jgi:hypothetical protein
MEDLLREALTELAKCVPDSDTSPLTRMARAALNGDAQALRDAKRQLQLQSQDRVAQVLPDELPILWAERADRLDKHGPGSAVADNIRKCMAELQAAISFGGYNVPYAYGVGLYHKSSTHDYPYHQKLIKWKETADACVKQWRANGWENSEVEIRVRPLFTAMISAKMEQVYQVVSAETDTGVHWRDAAKSEYERTAPNDRRILWSPKD